MTDFSDRFDAAFPHLRKPPLVPPPVPPVTFPPQAQIPVGARTAANADLLPPPTTTVPPATVPPAPVRPRAAFPADAAAVPYTAPPTGPAGITLASNPIAPGWAGTVGLPNTPDAAKGFEFGSDYAKMVSGLEQMAKGSKPKIDPYTTAVASTILPSGLQPNQPNALAFDLMNQMLLSKQRGRGLTLTGRPG